MIHGLLIQEHTDHVTVNRGLFKTLRLCFENFSVKVPNGVVTKVAGIGFSFVDWTLRSPHFSFYSCANL